MTGRYLFICWLSCISSMFLYAHGTSYEVLSTNTVSLRATFETGLPMRNARVLVFPPGSSEPEYSTECNEEGVFYVTPNQEGTWILQVRTQDGHGMRINLPVSGELVAESLGSGGISFPAKILMAVIIIWGAAGTALFFKGKQGEKEKGPG